MSTTIIPGPNVFRAISGSLFSTAANWSRGFVPTGSDVAMIGDNCVIDITRTVGSLVVRPGFTASINTGLTVSVLDTINVLGHLSCSGNPTINVISRKNSINTLSPGSSLFFFSGSSYDQTIPGVTYNNVWIVGSSIKRLTGNTIISGSLNIRPGSNPNFTGGGFIDAYLYDLTVSGSTLVDLSGATFRKSGPGRLTFIGNITGTDGNGSRMDLIGNPIVEFRNGITIQFYATNGFFDSGQGQWIFTTNNQNIEPRYATYNNKNTTLISGSIDVTVLGGQARSPIILSGLTNGTNANSRLINSGSIYLNYAPSPIPMSTGAFIYNATPISRLGFIFDGNYQLPYSSYPNLIIGGGGTKSIPAISSSVSASSLTFIAINNGPSTFDIANSNFYCGPINMSAGSPGPTLTKTTPGNVTIDGDIFIAQSTLDFRGGNPSVTFTGNLTNGANAINGFNSGTGSWYFPSISQSIVMQFATLQWNGPLLISGTLKFDTNVSVNHTISASINGTNSSARLINSGTITFVTANSVSSSFATGSADFTFPGNTVNLTGNYSVTIPTQFNRFSNLAISGTGTKTMSTSSIISGSLSMGTTGSLELGNNNLILLGGLGGPNDFSNRALLSKSGSGSILFAANIVPNTLNFNLSGNPTVEFRNGANLVNVGSNSGFFNFGTGSVIFSTNNQIFQGNGNLNLSGSLIISGGITVTLATFAGGGRMDIYNTINGTTGSSVLVNNTTLYFYNSSSYTPMATSGTFSYLNPLSTLGYIFNGDLNLPYTQYHNLVVGGTGSKFLSGDTYLSGSFSYDTNGILDCSTYSLIVSGGFGNAILNTFIRKNSNIGSLTFYGNAYTNGTTWQLIGNPQVEFRNGLRVLNSTVASQSFGSGSMVFSQNNQIIAANGGLTFANPITVSGSITLTLDGFAFVGNHIFSGSINGTDSNSRLTIGSTNGPHTITYLSPQRPMVTGLIDFSTNNNTFIYGSGSQDVRGGTYRNLTFLNGLKTLQGNVSVLGTFSTGSGATSGSINLNGFTLTNP
jgi:hypothetical protein